MHQLQQSQLQMEALLLLVAQIAMGTQHDLHEARQVLLAEAFRHARYTGALVGGNLEHRRIAPRHFGHHHVPQEAQHLPGKVLRALSFHQQTVDGPQHIRAGIPRDRVHYVFQNIRGTVSSNVLEDVMDAVARNSSADVLRAIDRLLVEGQSAQHFARQMLRFLRNVMVAKVAGSDSPVLQISSDERARVARVAERFSEEDLARFMQIMLRTHSDLGYKQEQRFHLELGLLKLVHAQRLLPLEELLSGEAGKTGAAGSSSRAGGATPRPAVSPAARSSVTSRATSEPEPQSSRVPAASPFTRPSPFEADRQRKSEPKAQGESDFTKQPAASVPVPRSNAQAEPEISDGNTSPAMDAGVATAVAVEPETGAQPKSNEITVEAAREAVLGALEDAGQQMLAHNLEEAEWAVRGIELCVTVAMSQVLIDVALGPEPKRVIQAALSKATGRPLKFKMAVSYT